MSRDLFQYHPIIGYQFIPGIKARIPHESGGYLLQTNTTGFRSDREFQRERSPEKFRILVFGDSFTAGDGVSNKHRYTDKLEQLIPDIEVYNFGLPGSGTDQQYLVWREIAREFEHDMVILAVQVENIRRVVAHYRMSLSRDGREQLLAKPYFVRERDGRLMLRGVPVPENAIDPELLPTGERQYVDRGGRLLWLRRFVSRFGSRAKGLVQRLSRQNPVPGYNSPRSPDWLLLKEILTLWISEISTPVMIVPIPLYHFIEEISDPRAYQARFRELAALPKVVIHDPLPDLLTYSPEARRGFRFAHDVHPTITGHQAIADSLAKKIVELKELLQGVS